jgi:hypothetical protein
MIYQIINNKLLNYFCSNNLVTILKNFIHVTGKDDNQSVLTMTSQ